MQLANTDASVVRSQTVRPFLKELDCLFDFSSLVSSPVQWGENRASKDGKGIQPIQVKALADFAPGTVLSGDISCYCVSISGWWQWRTLILQV